MSTGLLLLILLSAVLHATWNFFAKRAGGSVITVWIGASISVVLLAPFALYVQWGHPLSSRAMVFGVSSGVIHAVYWWALARMYGAGDISLAYPIARGSGVMGAAIGGFFLFGDPMPPVAWVGVILVTMGIFLLGSGRGRVDLGAILRSLLTGATIIAYALIDDRGVQIMHPVTYMLTQTVVAVAVLGAFGARRFSRRVASEYMENRSAAWVIGIGSPVTYIIVLFAMTLAPVGYVFAVREMAVVIGAVLGVLILKERMTPMRAVGIGCAVAGVLMIRLA